MDEKVALRQKMLNYMQNLDSNKIDDVGEYYKQYLTFMPIQVSECINDCIKEYSNIDDISTCEIKQIENDFFLDYNI